MYKSANRILLTGWYSTDIFSCLQILFIRWPELADAVNVGPDMEPTL